MRARTRLIPALLAAFVAASCATGDGTTLRPPAPGQTSPPSTTAPPATDETLPAEPVTTLPPPEDEIGGTVPVPDGPNGFAAATAWEDGGPIETRFTCDGVDLAPPVSWSTAPAGTEEVAIVMVDDAAPQREFVHWVLGGVDPALRTLAVASVPDGAVQGLNYFGNPWYDGPCPPPGETHDYRLEVHALGEPLGFLDGAPADEMIAEITRVSIASARVTGSYGT